jgi:hypothetical protein
MRSQPAESEPNGGEQNEPNDAIQIGPGEAHSGIPKPHRINDQEAGKVTQADTI